MLSVTSDGEQTKTELTVGEQYQLVVTQVLDQHLKVAACDYDNYGEFHVLPYIYSNVSHKQM